VTLKPILRGLLVIGSLVAIGFAVEESGLFSQLNETWIDREIRDQGLTGELLFLALGGLATAVGLPRQIVSFLGGYAFGFILGTTLGAFATLLGCILTFYYARWVGRKAVRHHFAKRVHKVDRFLKGNPFSMTLLIRLLPVGNNLVANLLAGVSSVPVLPYLAGSLLGFVPQTAIFALIGSGINVDPVFRIVVGAVLFIVSGLIGVWLYRKYRHGKTFDEALQRELEEGAVPAHATKHKRHA
jgi:uncharacterized membrane protein YdjX (TVP38/TMEM64 family)